MRATIVPLAAILLSTPLAHSAIQYTTTDLTTLAGSTFSRGYAISANNQVAGVSADQAFVAPSITSLSSPNSAGLGINSSNTVVGFTGTRASVRHAFSSTGGTQTDLHPKVTLGGNLSDAMAINNAGDVVGQAADGTGAFKAFYAPASYLAGGAGSLVTLNPVGGRANITAMDVNASRRVVGYAYNGTWSLGPNYLGLMNGTTTAGTAFIYDVDTNTVTTPIGGTNSYATAVNASGAVVGQRDNHAFLYSSGGVLTMLNEPAGTDLSIANDINTAGGIVGAYAIGTTQHAFVYKANTLFDLNDVIVLPGWTFMDANAINDAGFVTAYAYLNADPTVKHAFLLTPTGQGPDIPEPVVAGCGLAVLSLVRRRRT